MNSFKLPKFLITTAIGYLFFPVLLFAGNDGVSPKAYPIGEFLGLTITNSMVTGWIISLILIFAFRLLVRKPTLVPSGGQAVVENLLTSVKTIVEPIVGKSMIGVTFPLLLALFTFILIHNWSGLFPGVGTFGWVQGDELTYFFRPANADLNTTLALSVVSMVAWLYYVLRYAGLKMLLYDLFGNKAEKKEIPTLIFYGLFIIFFGVGIIEVISIAFRPVSLSFRLYGNVFGGENLLTAMQNMFAWILPVLFYILELLIGLVQALVFTILVAVYIGLICNHGDKEHAH